MAASGALQVVLSGDYATIVRADAPVGWWRLGDSEGYAQAVLSDNPFSFWRMDAASGSTETDRGSGGHNITYSGSFTLGQAGVLSDGDAAVDFVNQGALGQIGVVAAFSPTAGAPFTIEAWCQPKRVFSNASNYEIFSNENFMVSGLIMRLQSSGPSGTTGQIYVRTNQAGAFTDAQTAFQSSITIGAWVHAVWTFDGTNARLYVNGVLSLGPTAMTSPVAATFNSWVGGASGGQPFNGLLDETAFYSYALSAQQIANHYALRTSTIATVAKATIADASGNGHAGTVNGGVTLQQAAPQPDGNAAALFDGATGYVTMGNVSALAFTGAFSVEAWVKYTSAAGTAIAGKTNGSGGGWLLYVNTNRLALWAFTAGAATIFNFTSALAYNDGAYHHVVAEWDGTTSVGGAKIYVDGVLVGNATAAAGTPAVNSDPFVIGAYSASFGGTFPGTIDEVAAYGYALTPAQILNHYLAGQWTDITSDLTNADIAITRGFQSTAPDDLVAAPATLSVGLNNSIHNSGGASGYYSPDSSNLRPGFRTGILCRFRTTTNGNTRTRFYGWIQKITPLAGTFDEQSCAVTAASWMQMASSTIVAGIVAQINQRGDQLTATLAALATYPPFATAFSAGADTYPYAIDDLDPTSSTIVDGFDSIAKSGLLDRIWEQADGTLVFENRWIREQGVATLLTLTDVAPGGAPGQALIALPATRDRSILMNRFQVTVHPKRVDNVAVILYAYQTSASAPLIAAGATVTIQAPFVDPSLQSNKVGGFNTIIDDGSGNSIIGTTGPLPAADWQMTSATGGAGVDLSSHFTVSVTYSASQASFAITNTGTLAGFIARLQCRGQGIYDYQVIVGIATNASSQTQQSQLTTQVDCPYQPDPNFAQLAAQYLVLLFGTSLTTLDQGVQLFIHAGDDATMDGLLQREISDPIAITETVTGLSANQYWINAIKETYDERMNLTLTWSLQLRDTNQYWILGEAGRSELGNTTLMGYV